MKNEKEAVFNKEKSDHEIKCFADVSDHKCSALRIKNCNNCHFFIPQNQFPDYKKYTKLYIEGKKI